MHRIVVIIKRSLFLSPLLVLSLGTPLAGSLAVSYADPAPAPCVAPTSTGPGVHQPSGSDAGTYTYQCTGTYAGKWTNAYYVYDPSTMLTSPLYAPEYSYDCSTKQWSMLSYDYNVRTGSYTADRVNAVTAPILPTNCPVVAPTSPSATTGSAGSTTPSTSTGSGSTINGTGTGSANTISSGTNLNVNGTNTNTLSLGNTLNSQAGTGNAMVIGNTTGGSATSGDAQTIANIANLLQSSTNAFGPGTTTFTANINGNVNGDFMFDPSAILNTGTGSTNSADTTGNLTINQDNTTNAAINNTITVGANTGNAAVANNTTGGDATSGNATAIVNLMNLINSTVGAGHSFVGTININGDLNGDILLPQGLVDQMLASTGSGSTNTATTSATDTSTLTNNTTEGIANNINSTATSGTANVSGNTAAGSATSGTAKTNVTLLNLTGSNVVGANDLLVFVNVLGHWVGMIMNAPAGSTSAELGGGITDNGTGSTNSATNSLATDANVTNNTNLGITNNVNVSAHTGDANVTGNTTGGNAKTGDANTAVNILNLEGSNFDLSNFFGVLFINVFGIWNGSFGVNTSAGDPVATDTPAAASSTDQSSTVATTVQKFASFAAGSSPSGTSSSDTTSSTDTTAVLGANANVSKKIAATSIKYLPKADNAPHASYAIPIFGASIALLMLIAERLVSRRATRR